MVSKINSLGINGIGGYKVSVECSISQGLPGFEIVGLPDMAVREARDRVRAAIKNSGFKFPLCRITVNLAPADTKKAGTLYDLPVLLGILESSGEIKSVPKDSAFLGELSLAGELRPIRGALPMALEAERCGIKRLFVPCENAKEAAYAQNLSVIPISCVRELISYFAGEKEIAPESEPPLQSRKSQFSDFSEVMGQQSAKRALEVAAAGGHNILMIGPPGAGKSMLAKRLPGILPDMSRGEIIEATEIHSVAGLTNSEYPLISERPFRAPHHTVSAVAVSGGGAALHPGEISLAHNGVLFLDELPEFPREVLEVLRQPLEDGQVLISRSSGSVQYPAHFMLVCAMNPCKCGWHGHPKGKCRCSEREIIRYRSRISGPLLDRIDIVVEVEAIEYDEMRSKIPGEKSEDIKKRVNAARQIQQTRFGEKTVSNARMGRRELVSCCTLSEECDKLMKRAFEQMGLTGRSHDRILKVARTIADLDESESIKPAHLAEAISYRSFDLDSDVQ